MNQTRTAFLSFPGSAWERTVPRLCLVASPTIRKQNSPKDPRIETSQLHGGRASGPCVPRQSLGTRAIGLIYLAVALAIAPQIQSQEKTANATVEKNPMITNSIGMKLVRIPPGKFRMGSP